MPEPAPPGSQGSFRRGRGAAATAAGRASSRPLLPGKGGSGGLTKSWPLSRDVCPPTPMRRAAAMTIVASDLRGGAEFSISVSPYPAARSRPRGRLLPRPSLGTLRVAATSRVLPTERRPGELTWAGALGGGKKAINRKIVIALSSSRISRNGSNANN